MYVYTNNATLPTNGQQEIISTFLTIRNAIEDRDKNKIEHLKVILAQYGININNNFSAEF